MERAGLDCGARIARDMGRPHQLALLGALFLGALDQTVVVAILPQIVQDLRIPFDRLDDAAWAVTGYLAGYAFILPLAGQVADRGRFDRLVVACLGLFAFGSAVTASTSDLGILVAGRIVQAVGAGALLPVALGRAVQGADVRATAVRAGIVTAIAEGGALLGPVYGAVAIQFVDWRWVFLLNIPVAIALAFGLTWRSSNEGGEAVGQVAWFGAGSLGVALSAAVLALSREGSRLAGGAGRPLLVAVSAISLAALAAEELRARTPLLPTEFLRSGSIIAGLGTQLLGGAALIFPLVLVPVWGNTLLGYTPAQASLVLARMTLAIPVGALVGGAVSRWVSPRWPATAGMAGTGVALALMARWPLGTTETEMTPSLLLAGLGFGLMLAPTNAAVLAKSGEGQATTAASLLQSARLVGMAFASAGLASYGLDRFGTLAAALPAADLEAYAAGLRGSAYQVLTELLGWGAVVGLAAAVPAAFIASPKPKSKA